MFLEEVFCFKLTHLLFHPALSYNPEFHPSHLTVMHAHQPMLELYFIFICSLHSVVAEKRNFTHSLNHESLFCFGTVSLSLSFWSKCQGWIYIWRACGFPSHSQSWEEVSSYTWAQVICHSLGTAGFVFIHSPQAAALRGFPLPPLQLWSDSTSQGTFYELYWVILWITG